MVIYARINDLSSEDGDFNDLQPNFDLEEHLQETMDLSHQARGFLSFFPSILLQKRRNTSCHMKRWPTINGPRAYS